MVKGLACRETGAELSPKEDQRVEILPVGVMILRVRLAVPPLLVPGGPREQVSGRRRIRSIITLGRQERRGRHLFIAKCCTDFSVASGGIHKRHIGNTKKLCWQNRVQVRLSSLLLPVEMTQWLFTAADIITCPIASIIINHSKNIRSVSRHYHQFSSCTDVTDSYIFEEVVDGRGAAAPAKKKATKSCKKDFVL